MEITNQSLRFAVEAARAAGAVTLKYFGGSALGLDKKRDGTPVTRADREAEVVLRDHIAAVFPDDGIVGEEYGVDEGTTGRTWILDPIDGTKSFARGVPLYGTLVALEEDGEPIIGVIYMPALGEMVYASRREGAFWVRGIGGPSGERVVPARVSDEGRPEQALACWTSARGFEIVGQESLLAAIRARFGRSRGWGDCYGHLLVATGRAEAMFDPVLAIWDTAALRPVIEASGGAFLSLDGRATHRGESGVSVNARLTEYVRSMLADTVLDDTVLADTVLADTMENADTRESADEGTGGDAPRGKPK